jgi:hypothetical protein
MIWDRTGTPTVDVALQREAARATEYALDGAPSPIRLSDGKSLKSLTLTPGRTRIFRLHSR